LIEAYADAVSNWDYHDDRSDVRRQAEAVEKLNQCQKAINVQLTVAEAAIAYAEYQASNPGVDAKDYFHEQCRLWDAFMAAHKAVKAFEKAEEACKSVAGEGET
jgi:hypothetical protein